MAKYRKKPVVIEAYMFAGGADEPGWPGGWLEAEHYFSDDGEAVFIKTLEGTMAGRKGDFIIKAFMTNSTPASQISLSRPMNCGRDR